MKAPKEVKKGMSRTAPYTAWVNMKQACDRDTHKGFDEAGKQGLGYVASWKHFEGFWLDMRSTWQSGSRLCRIDKSLSYYKANCYWMPPAGKRRKVEDRNNKYGVRGLCKFTDMEGYVSWMYRHTVDHQRVSKVFSWNQYGEHKAFMLALLYIESLPK